MGSVSSVEKLSRLNALLPHPGRGKAPLSGERAERYQRPRPAGLLAPVPIH
jgi:hypothetical protein